MDDVNSIILNGLPQEVLLMIYEYLDVVDLKNMKLVSKWFANSVSMHRIKELVVGIGILYYEDCNSSHFANKPFKYQDLYEPSDPSDLSPFQSALSSALFENLNYLNFATQLKGFNFECLDQLVKLEHLEIHHLTLDKNINLDLHNLKTLHIQFIVGRNNFIRINSTKLKALKCEKRSSFQEKTIEIAHPSTIEILQIDNREAYLVPTHRSDFASFENLKIYSQDGIDTNVNIISILPESVNELYLDDIKLSDESIQYVSNLILQKKVLRKCQLKIYLMRIQLVDGKQLKDYGFDYLNWNYVYHRENYDLYVKNYGMLAGTLPFITNVCYDYILKRGIQNDFHQRFCNIQNLSVGKVVDEDALIKFIGSIKNLSVLTLNNSSQNQQFYDQLPSLSSLRKLSLRTSEEFDIDFRFVCKLKNLIHFNTNSFVPAVVPLDIIRQSFKSSRHLRVFEFTSTKFTSRVERYESRYSFVEWEIGMGGKTLENIVDGGSMSIDQLEKLCVNEGNMSIDQLEKLCNDLTGNLYKKP